MSYWGSNPFTNYSAMPQQSPYGMGWQNPGGGLFNANALGGGMGNYGGGMSGLGGGMGGYMGSPSFPSMWQQPSWGSPWGGFGGGMGGGGMGGFGQQGNQGGQTDFASMIQRLLGGPQGAQGAMGYGQFQTKPMQVPGPGTPGPQIDQGSGPAPIQGGQLGMPPSWAQGTPSTTPTPYGIYGNVVHNGVFDGAGFDQSTLSPAVRQLMGY